LCALRWSVPKILWKLIPAEFLMITLVIYTSIR
jgi:hypothetical protein